MTRKDQEWVGDLVKIRKCDHELRIIAVGTDRTRIIKEGDNFYLPILSLLESRNPDRVIDARTLGVTPIILAAHMKQKRR